MEFRAGTVPVGRGTAFLARSRCMRSGVRRVERRHLAIAPGVMEQPQQARAGADYEDLSLPGGSYGWPILGETVEFLKDTSAFTLNRINEHGNIFKTHIFGSKTVVICGAEALKKVYQLEARGALVVQQVTPGYRVLGADNLVCLDGAQHAHLRKLLFPAFSRDSVISCLPLIVDTAKKTCTELEGKDWFPLTEEVKKHAFKISTDAFLGIEFPSRSPSDVMALLHDIAGSMLTLGIDLPFTKYHKGVKSHAELTGIIEESIQAMEGRRPEDGQAVKALRQILDATDEDGNGIDMAVIINTVIVLFSAGFDTISSTMDAIFHGLALNPKVWDNLRKEQRLVMKRFGSDITPESLDAMVYATAVVKEGLRAQPMVPFLFKRAEKSFELDGYQIPVGMQIMTGVGFTTRYLDGRWSDGDAFRPERYLEAGADKVDTFAPFGMGAHTCLGKELALIEMRVVLAVLARDYEVRLRDPHARVEKLPFPHAVDGCLATMRRLHGSRA